MRPFVARSSSVLFVTRLRAGMGTPLMETARRNTRAQVFLNGVPWATIWTAWSGTRRLPMWLCWCHREIFGFWLVVPTIRRPVQRRLKTKSSCCGRRLTRAQSECPGRLQIWCPRARLLLTEVAVLHTRQECMPRLQSSVFSARRSPTSTLAHIMPPTIAATASRPLRAMAK